MINEYIDKYKKELDELKKKDKICSYFRLVMFLGCIVMFILGFQNTIFFVFSFVFLVLFIIAIFIHIQISSRFSYRLETSLEYDNRIKKEISSLEKGLNVNNYLSEDLGLFNENSIYQYISICKTDKGKRTLKEYLLNGNSEKHRANKLVNKLIDLDFHIEFSEHLKKYNLTNHQKVFIKEGKINKLFEILSYFLSVSTIVLIILSTFLISYHYFILTFLLNIIVVKMALNKTDINKTVRFINELCSVNDLVCFLTNYKIDDDYYKELTNFKMDYYKSIKRLEVISTFRENELLSFVFNGLFGIDVIIAKLFNKVKVNEENYNLILNNIGCLEALTSLSVIGLTNDIYSIPEFGYDLEFEGLYHPLVKNAVLNDFKLDKREILITGSNMSGKTTFMRSIAVNVILANAGGVVLAKKLKLKEYVVLTSMIVHDDLYNGISTFQAELKKLKYIIENISSKEYIIFLDEIFRGTNQTDRIKGAKYLIEYLNKENITLFISTHDKDLFNLDIDKYHFSEYYVDDVIKFDYVLKKGISTKTNAIALMKMIGLNVE